MKDSATGQKRIPFPGLGWAALGVLAFSFTFPATALAERAFSAYLVGAGRSVIAAAIAAVCLRAVRAPLPTRDHWPALVAVAVGCGIGFGLLSALALDNISSSHAAVVVGLLPAATAVVAVIRVGDRPRSVFWAASAVATTAVVGFALMRGAGTLHIADLLLLVALIIAAVGYAEGGRLARAMPGWQVIAWGVLIALPISLPVTVAALIRAAPMHASVSTVVGLAYLGIISTFLGFFAWYRGLAAAGVAKASQLQLMQPLLTIAWSAPLLGDQLDWTGLLIAILVAGCVLITQRAALTRAPPTRVAMHEETPRTPADRAPWPPRVPDWRREDEWLEGERRERPARATAIAPATAEVRLRGATLRFAVPGDECALENLGSQARERPPRGLVLLAEVNGVPWAAVSLDDSHAVSAPWPGASDLLFDLLGVARARRRAARVRNPRVWPAQPELPIAPLAARTTRARPERRE